MHAPTYKPHNWDEIVADRLQHLRQKLPNLTIQPVVSRPEEDEPKYLLALLVLPKDIEPISPVLRKYHPERNIRKMEEIKAELNTAIQQNDGKVIADAANNQHRWASFEDTGIVKIYWPHSHNFEILGLLGEKPPTTRKAPQEPFNWNPILLIGAALGACMTIGILFHDITIHLLPIDAPDRHSLKDDLSSLILILGVALPLIILALYRHYQKTRETQRKSREWRQQHERDALAAAELAQSEERYRALAENARSCIYILDLEGYVTYANEATCNYLGRTRSEILGRSIDKLLPHPWGEQRLKQMQEVIHTGKETVSEGNIRFTMGEHWMVTHLTPLRAANDSIEGIMGIAHDETERHRLEQQIQKARRLESLGNLAGGIAHDLNNVLTPIQLGIEMLKKRAQDSNTKTLLAFMQTSTTRGSTIVRQILTSARGADGQRRRIALTQLLNELQTSLSLKLPKNIQLSVHIDPQTQAVVGDPHQLLTVLNELCQNAIHAMPKGGQLLIQTENMVIEETNNVLFPDAQPGRYVGILIHDTGSGINNEDLEHIFEPFFTTRKGKGVGMGLATARGIINSHKGMINVVSQVGEGTNVVLSLPTCTQPTPIETPQPQPSTGTGQTLLVVDDESSVLQTACQILNSSGYQTLPAENGEKALDIYEQNKEQIAAVFTDITMPGINGMDLARTLKKRNPKLPIVGTSGRSTDLENKEIEEAGFYQIIAKPYTIDEILQTIHNAIHNNNHNTKQT